MVRKDGSKKVPDHGRSEGDRFVTRDVAANKYNSGTGSEKARHFGKAFEQEIFRQGFRSTDHLLVRENIRIMNQEISLPGILPKRVINGE